MFRNKVLVRADPPFSPPSTASSPFLFTQIHLDPSQSPSSSVNVESLCWKISRKLPVACFLHSPSTIFLVYRSNQAVVARKAIKEIVQKASVSNVDEEDELSSTTLVAKAVECGLKSLLLNSGWKCVGDSCFVYSNFSSREERRHLMAFTVSVQSEKDGSFVFLVSPDVIRFSRFEITSLVSSSTFERFDNGEEVAFEDHNFATSCCTLPSLFDGHALGVRKLLPAGEDLLQFEDVWSSKHGLQLPSDYFIKIQLHYGGCADTQWYPSSSVLRGGFSPAPQSIRITECVQVLQSFMRIIEGWDFFKQGKLKIKSIFSLTIGSELLTWTQTAREAKHSLKNENCSFNKNETINKLLSVSDFRTAKIISTCDSAGDNRERETAVTNLSSSKIASHSDKEATQCRQPAVPKRRGRSRTVTRVEETVPLPKGVTAKGANRRVAKICNKDVCRGLERNQDNENSCLSERAPLTEGSTSDGANQRLAEICNNDVSKCSERNQENKVLENSCLSVKMDCAGKAEVSTDTCPRIPLKEINCVPRRRTYTKEDKINDIQPDVTKKKFKSESSPSDINAKVIDCHSRGQLDSLTVVQLKGFLASKQAKVNEGPLTGTTTTCSSASFLDMNAIDCEQETNFSFT